MKNLIIYYSFKGHTETAAKELAKLLSCDIVPILEVKPRKKSSFLGAGFSASVGLKSKIRPFDTALSDYDNIFLGTQVWAGHSVPVINAFLEQTDFTGKNVYLFTTQADPKKPQAVIDSIVNRIEAKGGKVIDSVSIQADLKDPLDPVRAKDILSFWVKKQSV